MSALYDSTVPTYVRLLDRLEYILQKGEQHCRDNNISEAEILQWRIAPDMLPLSNQVQIVCNGAKNFLTRVSSAEIAAVPDDETTLEQLHARIAKTRAFFDDITPAQFEGRDQAEVVMTIRGQETKFTGWSYAQTFALPNLYFHITTVYLLFRSHGAPLGKMDYLDVLPA